MRKYKLIGLTGQSGAGKSTVAKEFEARGATVISADGIVAQLYAENSPCLKTIAACFGADVIRKDGTPDRKLLAQRAFSCPENTALLGKIVHPFVTARLLALLKDASGEVVYDAPQLFESGADAICDHVIAVTAGREIRLKRILERDGISVQEAERRLDAQLSEEFFRTHADEVIENNTNANVTFDPIRATKVK